MNKTYRIYDDEDKNYKKIKLSNRFNTETTQDENHVN